MKIRNRKGERGATMAEFAIGATVFFMVIIGIIEFSRLLYTHNALTDAARRGARYASLRPSTSGACVRAVVVYGETHIDPNTCLPTGPALINGLTTGNVVVNYDAGYNMNTGNVSVSIQNYSFNLSIPLFRVNLPLPAYRTTLPAESAGVVPADI